MKSAEVKIREALIEDAPLVGLVVLMALGYDDTHPIA